jgi:hypothetical protein
MHTTGGKKGKIQQKHCAKTKPKKNRPERKNSHKEEQAKAGKLNPSPSTTPSTMLLLLHLSPPPSKLLLLEQSTRQASSSSSSSWCDMKKEMMRQHFQPQTPILAEAQQWSLRLTPPIYPTKPRKQVPKAIGQQALEEEQQQRTRQTLLLGAKLCWFLKLFCVPLRLALLACLLSKGFRTWLLCQSWRWSEGGGRGGGLGMTREACNGCKTRRERRRRRRRGFLRKKTVLETPAKKAANQTVLVVFLPSLERKSTLLFLSLSTFSSERL